jgi:hypothetical protein
MITPKDAIEGIGALLEQTGIKDWAWNRTKLWLDLRKFEKEFRRAPEAALVILVARLEGDQDRSQTGHVVQSLHRQLFSGSTVPAIQIAGYPETLGTGDSGDVEAARLAAEATGRAWLRKYDGDILVWGKVAWQNAVFRLNFLEREAALDHQGLDLRPLPFGLGGTGFSIGGDAAKGYDLGQPGSGRSLELTADFDQDVGMVLAAMVLNAAIPPQERMPWGAMPLVRNSGSSAERLAPIVGRLEELMRNLPAAFSSDLKATLWNGCAYAECKLFQATGDRQRLLNAIALYQNVLTVWPRDRNVMVWVELQMNLGAAYRALGDEQRGTAIQVEATKTFQAAQLTERLKGIERMIENGDSEVRRSLGWVVDSMREQLKGLPPIRDQQAGG